MKKLPTTLKFILINFVIALLIIVSIAVYILFWLDEYTEHGSFIAVPEFENSTLEDAEHIASKLDLKLQIVDSLYDDDSKPGVIIEQYPIEGSHVKAGRTIHLTINAKNPEKVAIPNLRNSAFRQTLRTLSSKGFKIGKLEYIPSEFQNLVLDLKHNGTVIEPGTKLIKGSVIDIVLGNGNDYSTITIPDIKGMNLDAAIQLLRKTYLNIGDIIPDESITSTKEQKEAVIYYHKPTMEEQVERGTAINLYITVNKEKLTAADSLIVTE